MNCETYVEPVTSSTATTAEPTEMPTLSEPTEMPTEDPTASPTPSELTECPTPTPTAEECDAEPMAPYTNEGGLVPQGQLMFVPDASVLPESCGDYVFEPMTYEQVPDECCDAGVVALNMPDVFTSESTCFFLPQVNTGTEIIDVYLAGGCSDDGDFFYGEQCGGSTYGPFSYLSDGTYMGLGACEQPGETCTCNGYVNTRTAGCFNVAAFEGSNERYFMRVNDPVCAAPETAEPTETSDCTDCVTQEQYDELYSMVMAQTETI